MKVSPQGLIFAFLSFFFVASQAYAGPKSVVGQFGFGVDNIGIGQTPALSMDWQSSEAGSFELLASVQTQSSNNELRLGIRSARNLFIEEHEDFFLFVGAGFLSRSSGNGYTLEGGAGSRVFFSDFPNLGLSFAGGFNLESANGMKMSSKVLFGIHYYF